MYTEGSPYLQTVPLSNYEQHLVDLWFDCGTVCQGGMGITSLEWCEIIKWANQFYSETYIEWVEHPRASKRHKQVFTPIPITQCILLDWELKVIKDLSQSYCAEYSEASDPSRECPIEIPVEISEDDAIANASAIADGFKALFGGT